MLKHVEVYRNLHNGKMSVRDCKTRRVIAHVDTITLAGVGFRVSKAGRERVLREGRKNVHAFVSGKVIHFQGATPYKGRDLSEYIWEAGSGLTLIGDGSVAVYNPYKYESFVIPQDGYKRIQVAHMCHVTTKGIYLGDASMGGVHDGIEYASKFIWEGE